MRAMCATPCTEGGAGGWEGVRKVLIFDVLAIWAGMPAGAGLARMEGGGRFDGSPGGLAKRVPMATESNSIGVHCYSVNAKLYQ